MKTIRSRIILILLLAIGSVLSLLPRTVTERALDPETGQVTEHEVRRVPIELGLDLRGGVHLALELDPSGPAIDDCSDAIDGAARVIRNRVSEFGTSSPMIQAATNCRLIVELPGESDPVRARAIVEQTAFLEFRLVDGVDRFDQVAGFVESSLGQAGAIVRGSMPGEYLVHRDVVEDVAAALASAPRRVVPSDLEVRWGTSDDGRVGEEWRALYLVAAEPVVTGEDLVGATPMHDPMTSLPQVRFELTNRGGRAFGNVSAASVGEFLAIVLDGRVQGAPAQIRERIGAIGTIELPNRTMREAGDLALVLRAGALPAPLRVVEQSSIGPSLGTESIRAGLQTSALAVVLVMLAMVAYYRTAGILAVGALGLYLLFSLGGLAALGFTLTLPGIAGFAVAIGMAVDANVLIFERIREELRGEGRSVRRAVDRGFRNALSAIVDSNVTTALTALILYRVGTDSVKGFAVTLLIGLAASMFAAIFVTRTFFSIWLRRKKGRAGPKFWRVGPLEDMRLDFMRARRKVFALSAAFIAAGVLMTASQGMSYGIDFTGGTLLHIRTEQVVSGDEIRAALVAGDLDASGVQSYGSDRDFLIRTRATTPLEGGAAGGVLDAARSTLDTALGDDGYEVMRGEGVDPQVGSELQQRAGAAIGLSFLSTLAYLGIRFDQRLGLAAVMTTAHDIFATLAFMSLLDIEISLITVAGVLTVIGYSLNDTIVIFDRVRENLRSSPGAKLREVLNRSIAQTLPRTVLTTGTTLLAGILLATMGGATIRPLALVMSFGIMVGTLSSIFVASPALLWLSMRRAPSAAG